MAINQHNLTLTNTLQPITPNLARTAGGHLQLSSKFQKLLGWVSKTVGFPKFSKESTPLKFPRPQLQREINLMPPNKKIKIAHTSSIPETWIHGPRSEGASKGQNFLGPSRTREIRIVVRRQRSRATDARCRRRSRRRWCNRSPLAVCHKRAFH